MPKPAEIDNDAFNRSSDEDCHFDDKALESPVVRNVAEKDPETATVRTVVDIVACSIEYDEFPDGGLQAWLIIVGSFVAHFVVFGNIYAFGVYNSFYANIGS
ncbi:hypothetical protein HDU98_000709 [Podochytrium sp. JEL0797]|nr:hypothetical protein HDU98_000709 [Podochytrium sp. JEL0797]